jgi:iron complex outermembrane receptor protein
VKEGFAEVVVPLAKDQAWAQNLELNGAVRYTDYSTSGGVTTWKVGMNYNPISDLRFRATASKDIRAANVNELFSGTNQVINSVVDPRDNVARQTLQLTGGNKNLTPEESDTYEGGVIYSPSWFSGFRMSVDYYSIDIADVITSLSGQQIADGCLKAGKADLCALIARNPTTGIISSITATLFNANELKTSGIDLEAQYKFPLDQYMSGMPGTMSLRLLTNYVKELITVQNGISTDNLKNIGIGQGPPPGVPQWRSTFSMNYTNGPFSTTGFLRYVGGGNFNNAFIEGVDIANNTVDSRTYIDLAASYQLRPNLQLYGKIDNVVNTDPPLTPNAIIQPSIANSVFYDQFGRYYTAGIRFSF